MADLFPPSSSTGFRASSPSLGDNFRPQPAQPQRSIDPLALGADQNVEGANGAGMNDSDSDDEIAARRASRRRVRGMQDDIPRVTDATGEAVMASFQTFLETFVST